MTSEQNIRYLLGLSSGTTYLDKLDFYSALLIGTRYQANPVGDGPTGKFDARPIIHFDGFDCQTYLETVICLASSVDFSHFFSHLINLRYFKMPVEFWHRNHYLHCQWIPHNIKYGSIREIEVELVEDSSILIQQDLRSNLASLQTKYSKDAPLLKLPIEGIASNLDMPPDATFLMIPFKYLVFRTGSGFNKRIINADLIGRIPHSSLISFFFTDKEHMALFIRKHDGTFHLRHARTQLGVVESLFDEYLFIIDLFSNCIGLKIFQLGNPRTKTFFERHPPRPTAEYLR